MEAAALVFAALRAPTCARHALPPPAARKFDRPTTAHKPSGASLKRKLLISPGGERWGCWVGSSWHRVAISSTRTKAGDSQPPAQPAALPATLVAADISAAFPSVSKPAAKQRRRSLSGAGDARACGGAAEQAAPAPAGQGSSGLGDYWSDPLPLGQAGCAAARQGAAPDDDMADTAASPASSGGSGCCSPAAGSGGMDTCCCRSPLPPAFSPLRECRVPLRACSMTPSCELSLLGLLLCVPTGHPAAPPAVPAAGGARQALPTVDHPECGFPAITPQVRLEGEAAPGSSQPAACGAGRIARWPTHDALALARYAASVPRFPTSPLPHPLPPPRRRCATC